MILKESTSAFISTLIISALLMVATTASAQKHYVEKNEKDSVALLQSVEASIDGVGPMMKVFGDYGHVEHRTSSSAWTSTYCATNWTTTDCT